LIILYLEKGKHPYLAVEGVLVDMEKIGRMNALAGLMYQCSGRTCHRINFRTFVPFFSKILKNWSMVAKLWL
jgi:hypothetical protein